MAKKKRTSRRKPTGRRKLRAGAGRKPRGGSRPFANLLSSLTRAYSRRRRPAGEAPLDRIVLAVLAEGRGERAAFKFMSKIRGNFVDWNEVRVARTRDLIAAAPEAPEGRIRKMQKLLHSLYENMGGLEPQPLLEKKATEARAWLARIGDLSREEVEAILMTGLGMAVIPGSEDLARVLRRMGLIPRKSTRARGQRAALKGLSPDLYREFYSLVSEHAATVCRVQLPECGRCKLRRSCKSKGKW